MGLTKNDVINDLLSLKQNTYADKKEVLFHGIPASPGISIASVRVVSSFSLADKDVKKKIPAGKIEAEVLRYKEAVNSARADILVMKERLSDSLDSPEIAIFSAHLMILDDPMLNNEVLEKIQVQHFSAESAFCQTARRFIEAISAFPDMVIRERVSDIQDVSARVLGYLTGIKQSLSGPLTESVVIIAKDLSPSDTANLDRSHVLGFAIETGSQTSHTAILARSMKIPAVVGMRGIVERLRDGDKVIVDGFIGMVVIHPTEETIAFYREKIERQNRLDNDLRRDNSSQAVTLDGFVVPLLANVEGTSGVDELLNGGAEGVGLFRTEFLFLDKPVFPDEESQFKIYRDLVLGLKGRSAIIRTLDVGGDKLDAALSSVKEANPFLGMRAIRLGMIHPELLKTQLAALLRAAVLGDIKILFPMVSAVSEVDFLKNMLEEVKSELSRRGVDFNPSPEIGIMIEIPSAALIAGQLAKKVDFFSIGTNDLVQYTLAVDRGNERVAYLYNPMHPAVLELIAMTCNAARENHIWVGCCGELAGDPAYVPLLLGLGVRELSMGAPSMPLVRKLICNMSMVSARRLVESLRRTADPDLTRRKCIEFIKNAAPDVAELCGK